MGDVTHRKRGLRFEKKQSWVLASEEDGWLSELFDALRRVPHVVWGRWKSQHRKVVYLSPYVEKPFNSKVIKCFVLELRSRKCFLCFGIPMLSIYELWTFYVRFTYSCMAMLQQFYLTHRKGPMRYYHSGLEWTRERWQWKVLSIPQRSSITGASSSGFVSVISGHSFGCESDPSVGVQLVHSTAPANWSAIF